MLARYVLVFLIGWGFNCALDANVVARETFVWLQHGWLASFYETAQAPRASPK